MNLTVLQWAAGASTIEEPEVPQRIFALAARASRAAGLPEEGVRPPLSRLELAVNQLVNQVETQRETIRRLETKSARVDAGLRAMRAASRISETVVSVFERERVLSNIPQALLRGFNASHARVWLVGPGDRCQVCAQAGRCTDRKRCLHLVPFGGEGHLDQQLARVPIGDFSVGRVAAMSSQVATNELQSDPGLADPEWAAAEQLTSFAGHPLIHAGRLLGVVAMWSQAPLKTEAIEALRVLARQAATAIAGAELIADVRQQSARSEAATGRLEALLEAARNGVIMLDPAGRVVYLNGAFRRLFHLGETHLVGVHRDELERRLQSLLRVPATVLCETGHHQDDELELLIPGEPTARLLRRYGAAVRSPDGAQQGSMAVFEDITQAREIDRMKNEFIGTVSHELRTPLTSIKGSLALLLDGSIELEPEIAQLLVVSKRNVDRLVRLVNDILDMSKIEAGQLELDQHPLSPERLCHDSVAGLLGFAQKAGVAVELLLEAALPSVLGDQDRVLQVLTNLLSNAIKFSPRGERVDLSARREGAFVRFDVVDRGPGIPHEFRDKLFTRFAQADRARREQEGTGLGLAISQALVLKHGGQIGCVSEPGHGACLFFTLPVADRTEATP